MRHLLLAVLLVAMTGCGSDTKPEEQPDGSATPIQLHLISNDDGTLKQIALNQQNYGNIEDSFRKIERELELKVEQIVKGEETQQAFENILASPSWQVDIAADQRLRFEYVHRAIAICAGHRDEKTGNWTSRFTKIRLITPDSALSTGVPHGFPVYVPLREGRNTDEIQLPDIKVQLQANPDGTLAGLLLGATSLGNDQDSFRTLNVEIFKLITAAGADLAKEIAVSINGDAGLRYQHVIEAIQACSGKVGPDGRWVDYVERIQFVDIGDFRAGYGSREVDSTPDEKPEPNPEK